MRSQAIAVTLLFLAGPLSGQMVVGETTDAGTGLPVRFADVSLLAADSVLITVRGDSLGRFEILAPGAGLYRLRASGLGYDTVWTDSFAVGAEEEVEVELRLGARAIVLEPLRVVERRRRAYNPVRDFYWRLEHYSGRGVLLSREDLERVAGLDMGGVMGRQPWVRQGRSREGTATFVFRSRLGQCVPDAYLDGAPIEIGDLARIRASELEGIEIYREWTQVPARYAHGPPCGAVLAWTRRTVPQAYSMVSFIVGGVAVVLVLLLMLR